MLLVLLIAAGLRLWDLPALPVGLHYDEAANVVLTRQIAYDGYRPLFIRAYTGKEVLFFYAAALWIRITGGASWGLRLGAAMLGILTVAATYAMARQLFSQSPRSRWIPIFAAAWMAILFPHLILSRYGFRAISLPLLETLAIALIWRGLRTGKWPVLLAGGAALGATGYTYLAARLFPVPIAGALVVCILTARGEQRQRLLRRWTSILGAALLLFAPLGLYFLRNPEAFSTRISQVASTTVAEALRGLWLCLRAIGWPGAGDPYIRFNLPFRAILDRLSALLALIGLGGVLAYRPAHAVDRSSRALVLAGVFCMVLPSALATSEITPSNLRLVGLFPFLVLLPAWGLSTLVTRVRWPYAPLMALGLVLVVGSATSGVAYARWASSSELFRAADGEMVLAAEALDRSVGEQTTVYIASEHYRHPTVAALSSHYADAKWLTDGASLVLPPTGDATYLIPRSLQRTWPAAISEAWTAESLPGPDGAPALSLLTLSAAGAHALRPSTVAADFAHIVAVHSAELQAPCYASQPCTVLVIWQPLVAYDAALQLVVRLWHPQSGEWARESRFHYPPEQWTAGEIVLDQITLAPPAGMPAGDAYRVSVGFFSPETQVSLPRLYEERFDGLEAQFPVSGVGFTVEAMPTTSETAGAASICAGYPIQGPLEVPGLMLEGWSLAPVAARPGDELAVDLCWHARTTLSYNQVRLQLEGPTIYTLFEGPPGQGYGFANWRESEGVVDRYRIRIPRDAPPGTYRLVAAVDSIPLGTLGKVEVLALVRDFSLPQVAIPSALTFGESLRLLGYDLGPLRPGVPLEIRLYWQVLAELEDDFTVFIHLVDVASGAVVAQVDAAPRNGSYPTSLWKRGEVVEDAYALPLGPDVSEDKRYTLRLGLYLPIPGTHLAAEDGKDWATLYDNLKLAP